MIHTDEQGQISLTAAGLTPNRKWGMPAGMSPEHPLVALTDGLCQLPSFQLWKRISFTLHLPVFISKFPASAQKLPLQQRAPLFWCKEAGQPWTTCLLLCSTQKEEVLRWAQERRECGPVLEGLQLERGARQSKIQLLGDSEDQLQEGMLSTQPQNHPWGPPSKSRSMMTPVLQTAAANLHLPWG